MNCFTNALVQLQLRLFVEGKETADGNETTSEFIVSVCPLPSPDNVSSLT